MFSFLAILSLVPFWASPERYLKEAEKEKSELRRENAIYYYRKCISKSPNYELRDSVYLALLDIYEEMGKDSLFLNTIDEFCEKNAESNFIPVLLYEKAQFFDKEYALPHSKPLKAGSLYNVIINDFGEAPIAEKAVERKAYLNEIISLPVGKVYKCPICGKFLKADKILKVKRKDKAEYLKKYPTEEIKKERCYEHQLIKVKTGEIQICPRCGRVISKSIYYKECMRIEKNKYSVKKIKASQPCVRCQDTEFSLGESMEEILNKLGEPHEKRGIMGQSPYFFIWNLPYGIVGLEFSYSHYTSEYTLVEVVPVHTQLPQTGRFERKGGEYFFEFYWQGENQWANLWSTPEKNLR